MTEPQQLLLNLPLRAALGRDDFMVTPSNAAAVGLVDEWPRWPSHGAILHGPEGAGKSHLAQVWRMRSNATILAAEALQVSGVPDLFSTPAICIEDLTPGKFDETALFHALNMARENQGHVLLTTRFDVASLHIVLPDLASRLKALPLVGILAPDDALLRGVLVKLFADRQIHVEEATISYVLLRMPRSLAAARHLVAEVDRLAMTERAEVTRSFVAKVMVRIVAPDFFTTS